MCGDNEVSPGRQQDADRPRRSAEHCRILEIRKAAETIGHARLVDLRPLRHGWEHADVRRRDIV